MVKTLFCAKEFFDDDLIISYADIIFNKKILNCIMKSNYDFNVVVDKDWEILWNLRMENPLEDAETLKIIDDNIVEIGKRALDITEIQGQYIGLVKISKSALLNLVKFYESLDKTKMYEGKDFDNMYMTTLIQLIIDHVSNVTPVYVNGGWIEIDSFDDLNIYCSNEKLTSKILNL
jgi:choline kinase